MTAAEGGPALRGAAAAAPADHGDEARIPARSTAPRLRTVLGLARVEAFLLVRSLLVLAGLLAGGAVVWVLFGPTEPFWWNAAWRIGFGQLVLGMAVLVAAQLAAGRARRDSMADLYVSFPATAGTRTVAHLAGLVGAAPASLLLIGAAAAVAQVRGAIGAPGITVLAGGVLLVIAAGAAGIAIGTRFPHPLAGVLGALVLFLSSATSQLGSGGGIWLLPWEWTQDQLGSLPGPLAGYPPVGAHVLETGRHRRPGRDGGADGDRRPRPVQGRAGDRGHRGPGGDLPRRSTATAAHPHRGAEPPGQGGRRPGLGAALHHRQPGPVLPLSRLRPLAAIVGGGRSTGCSRTCPPGLTSR